MSKKLSKKRIQEKYTLWLTQGQADLPIIKNWKYYTEIFGDTIARPEYSGDNLTASREITWYTDLDGDSGILTEDERKEKIEAFQRKKEDKINELKENEVDNADKINLLESFTLPEDEDGNYLLIKNKLVMVNWGIVNKDYEVVENDHPNDRIGGDLGIKKLTDEGASEDDSETDSNKDEEELEEEHDDDQGYIHVGNDEYIKKISKDDPNPKRFKKVDDSDGGYSFIPVGRDSKKEEKVKTGWKDWYWLVIIVAIIIILFSLRSCDEDDNKTLTDNSVPKSTKDKIVNLSKKNPTKDQSIKTKSGLIASNSQSTAKQNSGSKTKKPLTSSERSGTKPMVDSNDPSKNPSVANNKPKPGSVPPNNNSPLDSYISPDVSSQTEDTNTQKDINEMKLGELWLDRKTGKRFLKDRNGKGRREIPDNESYLKDISI
tara:strand:- start:9178 stop:10473 length:1296 start_codon:yes stop_codon:yes gene_type:complete